MWSQDTCANDFAAFGGVFGQDTRASSTTGGVTYDKTAAEQCLTTLASINCGTVPSAAWDSLFSLCFSALQGTQGIDMGTCTSSLQCKSGEYCSVVDAGAGDAGAGVCVSLKVAGQPCVDTGGSTDCSYRGTGAPTLYCGNSDAGTVCLPAQPVSGACGLPVQCESRLCNGAQHACVGSYTFSHLGVPALLTRSMVDAGPPTPDAGDAGDAAADGGDAD